MAATPNGNRDPSPNKNKTRNGSGDGGAKQQGGVAPSPRSGGSSAASLNNASKAAAQMQKMRDANSKYKNLLKMAKERIEQQEVELKELREAERKRMEEEVASGNSREITANAKPLEDANDDLNSSDWNLTRVSQLIRVDLESHELNTRGLNHEIWALCHFELEETDEQKFLINNNNSDSTNKKKQWKRFDAESDLTDFIRCDRGEPLTLPPYSLTPRQSSRTVSEADKKVSDITEEYRRFRVKSEMTRKQMDAQIRDLQSSQVEATTRQIEGQEHAEQGMESSRGTEHSQLERMRAEAARQEDQWREAYDILLKENEALKSSGSEALLASQWRQRYEACLKERDEAVNKLQSAQQRHEQHKQQQHSASFSSPPGIRDGKISKGVGNEGKYEMKYRDLKESFRLYRKKAKEIFESQAAAAATNNSAGGKKNAADMMVLQMSQQHSNAEEESKLDYLKNLMVNYLTADQETRDHMEMAIGTVLKFTPTDIAAIKKKKEDDASWGAYIGYT
ncbi:unnamed protein product [Pseudo-nitzschia multistriata]|uniref:GRIP domain-containing protein n=1 Tax=Pseudo-nitzschia multistriata TaxID=183589 RepID=A0A448ZN67_9STRA|nr:unnamed protein product [Pseudo-nitzschia multistriata]